MRCTEPPAACPDTTRRRWLAAWPLAGLLAGCGNLPSLPGLPGRSPAPPPAAPPPPAAAPGVSGVSPAAPAAPAPTGRAPGGGLGPRVRLGAPAAARNWDEFRRQAARRLVEASPQGSYLGRVPELLFGIPVLQVELDRDGDVRRVSVLRRPANDAARDTIALAEEAVRRAAPYGDMSRLPRPWTWTEVFLFDEQRRFKPRTLD